MDPLASSATRSMVCRIVGEQDADDVLQTAAMRALTGPPCDGRAAYATWFYRVAMNCALQHHRTNRRRRANLHDPIEAAFSVEASRADTPSAIVDGRRRLARVVGGMRPAERRLARMLIAGMRPPEIADRLAVPVETAKSRVFRMRRRLLAEHA